MAAALVFQDHFTLDDMEVHHRDELPTALAAPLFDWGSIGLKHGPARRQRQRLPSSRPIRAK